MGIPTQRSRGYAPQGGIPMSVIVPKVRFSVKQRLLKQLQQCRDAALKIRYLIIINLLNGRGAYATAEVLGVHNTTVYRVTKRFRDHGEWGLLDGRDRRWAARGRRQPKPPGCERFGNWWLRCRASTCWCMKMKWTST